MSASRTLRSRSRGDDEVPTRRPRGAAGRREVPGAHQVRHPRLEHPRRRPRPRRDRSAAAESVVRETRAAAKPCSAFERGRGADPRSQEVAPAGKQLVDGRHRHRRAGGSVDDERSSSPSRRTGRGARAGSSPTRELVISCRELHDERRSVALDGRGRTVDHDGLGALDVDLHHRHVVETEVVERQRRHDHARARTPTTDRRPGGIHRSSRRAMPNSRSHDMPASATGTSSTFVDRVRSRSCGRSAGHSRGSPRRRRPGHRRRHAPTPGTCGYPTLAPTSTKTSPAPSSRSSVAHRRAARTPLAIAWIDTERVGSVERHPDAVDVDVDEVVDAPADGDRRRRSSADRAHRAPCGLTLSRWRAADRTA